MHFQLPTLNALSPRNLAIVAVVAVGAALGACSGDDDAIVEGGPAGEDFKTFKVSELMAPGPLPENILGKNDAPVTLIEYSSLTCPHCANFHTATLPTLKEKYISTGKMRYILREFPLDNRAAAASVLARCIGTGDRYFAFVDVLYEKQAQWAFVQEDPREKLKELARQAGMTEQAFDACLDNRDMYDKLQNMRDKASDQFEVNSTPTFYVNGRQVKGGLPPDEFSAIIDGMLKK